MVAATVRTNLSRCLERCIQTSEPGSGHLDCDLAKRTAECLAKSSTKELHVEALCLEVASALEKHGRWRPAWDLLFGLMQHLGAASRTRAAASMYAHVVMRAASCAGRGGVSAGGDLCEIVELCFHLRSCFLEALSLNDKLGQRNVQARKLLEWLVHVAVPVSSHLLAKKCWQEVQQALQQGGNQAMKALMQGRTAEEQTQLVRLICCHARSVQPDAADLVADVLKALLAGQHRKSAKPNEVAIWLKAVMTTMDVLAHLLRSSWQKSSSMLDWADQFLADFSGTLAGGLESPSLQPLLLLLVRARVRVLEACRRESRELLAITRKEIFQLYGLQLWQSQLQETEGTAPLAPPAPCAPQCLLELLGCGRSWQQLEAVRLQLPAGSVAGALLALRQLQLHVEADDAASLLALGRLVLALSQDPDFRSLAPQALAAARRRLAGLGEGRGRLLAAQLCAVEAQLEASEAHQECERFLSQALSLWYRAAGLDRSSLGFSVNSVARVLRCCTGALVLRELLDAAHLLETLDLHVLTVQVLVLCLACMVQQQGPKGLWWLMPDKSGLPPDDSAQACVVLLYRLAAAEGRLATTDEEAFVALEWWQTAEAARAALRATDAVAVARAVCLGALPEAAILALHQRGCTLEVLMPECTAEMAGLLPHQAMTLAEAFLALAQWSAHWQDVSPGQCPGGSTITAQCAALKSLALLYGAPKPATERPQPTATNGPVAPWARWPAQRSALLQLRVIYQVSLLYERLGEAELAGACAESGLQLMERKLCGAHGWKLRFLCLRVDWKSQALQITRSIDSHPGRVISRRVQLAPGLLQCLQEDLQSLHAMNGEKIRELWQRPGKDSEAARLEFWSNRKRFDEQLGRVAERIQQELLGPWRCLLAPLPPGQWLRLREMARTWRQKEVSAEEEFLLALLLLEARQMEVPEIAAVLGDSKLRPASSLKRYSLELGLEEVEAPLLLYVDANMAQLPLEACPCLRNRSVVRGLAPNIMPATVAAATGFFVIDPAEDCTQMGDVKRLLTSWSEGQSWHGHTGLPMPAPAEVLDELCRNDVFVYLGHGERARQLLRQDRVRMPGTAHDGSGDLRSILMLLGCSSVKIRPQSVGAFECFGLPGRALLAGAPLVLGAMWDVLGGDLDKFACRLLQKWWQKPDGSQGGLLSALRLLRPKCLLPNLTGAALVCYGNPM
ncbi:unnamed protein product [Effrenium voratum]|nr:unnamed protein product [Effrenium voratum]